MNEIERIILTAWTVVLVATVIVSGCTTEDPEVDHTATPALVETQASVEYVEELRRSSVPEAMLELEEIVESSSDNVTRERAIFVLSDQAVSEYKTEEVADLLRRMTYDENDEVRSAAYANLDLIRQGRPSVQKGDLWVLVEGEIKEGGEITIILVSSSTMDAYEAKVGIKKIIGDGRGIRVENHRSVRFPLMAGESKGVPFTVYLERKGRYVILCELKLTFDISDYQIIEKEIQLVVGEESGTFEVISPLEEPEDID